MALRDGAAATGRVRSAWDFHSTGSGTGQVSKATRYLDTDSDGTNDEEYSTSYGYDPVGRPNDVTMSFSPSIQNGLFGLGGYRTQMSYYANGQLRSVQQPSTMGTGVTDENLTYAYDRLGNLKSLIGAGAIVADTMYTPEGLVTRRTLGPTVGKSVYDTRDYDTSSRRLTRRAVSMQESALSAKLDLWYEYDPSGNVTSLNDIANSDTTGTHPDSFRQCFKYDYLRRLTNAWTLPTSTDCSTVLAGGRKVELGTVAPYKEDFWYDKLGNRITSVEMDGPVGATRTAATHDLYYPTSATVRPHAPEYLESVNLFTNTTTRETYGYDNTGATTTRDKTDGLDQTITWDVEGHQTSVRERDGSSFTGNRTDYVYDADGNRIVKRVQGEGASTTYYVGDSEYVHTPGNANPISLVRNYSVGEEPVATRTSVGLITLIGERNNTGQLAIQDGSVVAKRRNKAFGTPLPSGTGTWPTGLGYLNMPTDSTTGTTHLGAREYDTRLGRFLSVDPVLDTSDPQQMNGYAYGGNSPVTKSDPSGLWTDGGLDTNRTAPIITVRDGKSYAEQGGYYTSPENQAAENEAVNTYLQSPTEQAKNYSSSLANFAASPTNPGPYTRPDIVGAIVKATTDLLTLKATRDSCGSDLTSGACALNAGIDLATAGASLFTFGGAAGVRGGATGARALGFAEGLGNSALTTGRLQHGTKNLTKAGVLPAWSGKESPGIIRQALTPVLEHPSATFNHTLGGTQVRGFLGNIDGKQVAAFVYKEGKYQGQLASSFVPSPNQLKMWGLM